MFVFFDPVSCLNFINISFLSHCDDIRSLPLDLELLWAGARGGRSVLEGINCGTNTMISCLLGGLKYTSLSISCPFGITNTNKTPT